MSEISGLDKFFAKGQAFSRYIHLFDLTFAFFTNLQERYRFFPYLKRQGKFDVSREGPSSGSNFHQKVEIFLVERSYTFRVLLNALRAYAGNLRSRYFNKLQSLYNHFFFYRLDLILPTTGLLCQQT